MLEFLEMEPIKVSRAVDAEKNRQDETLDPFEAQQRNVNKCLRDLRDAKMAANDGTMTLGTFGADSSNPTEARAERVEKIKRAAEAKQKIKTNEKRFKEGLADLESILATDEDKYKSNPADCQEEASKWSNISFEQTLKIREKTIELFNDQYQLVSNFGKKDRKAAGSALEDKANHFAMKVNDLGELPDLDPESWTNYNKYLARDKEIDDALQVLYEKNLVLKDRAIAIADHSKRVTAIETELSNEMEKVTARADGASSKMKKITDAIDGKGPGKICVYIMIALGIMGICYLLYCEAGDGNCEY